MYAKPDFLIVVHQCPFSIGHGDRSPRASEAFAVSLDFSLPTKELVEAFHQVSLKVIPWTLNSKQDWIKAIDMQLMASLAIISKICSIF